MSFLKKISKLLSIIALALSASLCAGNENFKIPGDCPIKKYITSCDNRKNCIARGIEQLFLCYYGGQKGLATTYKIACKNGEYEDETYRILGYFYLRGYGVKQNYKKAFECFSKSESCEFSLYLLGMLYETGNGTEKDLNKAFEYYFRANYKAYNKNKCIEDLGYRLAFFYLYGVGGVKQDEKKALGLLAHAAEVHGDDDALIFLKEYNDKKKNN